MFPALGQGGVYFHSASQDEPNKAHGLVWYWKRGTGRAQSSACIEQGSWSELGSQKLLALPWSRSVAQAISKPSPKWWHSSPLRWVGGCLQHWGLRPALPTPASVNLESCSSWWHPELTLPSFLFLSRKHALNCHRMKPALFNVLCEIKEKTGRKAMLLVLYYFSFCSLGILFHQVCGPPPPHAAVFKWGEITRWYLMLLAVDLHDVVCV